MVLFPFLHTAPPKPLMDVAVKVTGKTEISLEPVSDIHGPIRCSFNKVSFCTIVTLRTSDGWGGGSREMFWEQNLLKPKFEGSNLNFYSKAF